MAERDSIVQWGDLWKTIERIKTQDAIIKSHEKEVAYLKIDQNSLIAGVNVARRERALALLKDEGMAVCLTHRLVFRRTLEDSLVPSDSALVVQMNQSWEKRYQEYDSDTEVVHNSARYETVACKDCRDVLSHGTVSDEYSYRHYMNAVQKPSTEFFEKFYSVEDLDGISAHFGMPPISMENIKSL